MTPREASVTIAREVVQQWTGIVRFHTADTNYMRLIDIIATALDQQIERDAKVAEQPLAPTIYAEQYSMAIAAAIRQQGAR